MPLCRHRNAHAISVSVWALTWPSLFMGGSVTCAEVFCVWSGCGKNSTGLQVRDQRGKWWRTA